VRWANIDGGTISATVSQSNLQLLESKIVFCYEFWIIDLKLQLLVAPAPIQLPGVLTPTFTPLYFIDPLSQQVALSPPVCSASRGTRSHVLRAQPSTRHSSPSRLVASFFVVWCYKCAVFSANRKTKERLIAICRRNGLWNFLRISVKIPHIMVKLLTIIFITIVWCALNRISKKGKTKKAVGLSMISQFSLKGHDLKLEIPMEFSLLFMRSLISLRGENKLY
jgi:hypothetical protein